MWVGERNRRCKRWKWTTAIVRSQKTSEKKKKIIRQKPDNLHRRYKDSKIKRKVFIKTDWHHLTLKPAILIVSLFVSLQCHDRYGRWQRHFWAVSIGRGLPDPERVKRFTSLLPCDERWQRLCKASMIGAWSDYPIYTPLISRLPAALDKASTVKATTLTHSCSDKLHGSF